MTGSGESTIERARSAEGLTTVLVTEAVLSPRYGSDSFRETTAVLRREPSEVGRTTTVTVATASLAREPRLQESWPEELVAGGPPCEQLAITKTALVGSVSVTWMPVAMEGPKLVTVMV